MALLLAATGLFVHQQLQAKLDSSLNAALRGRAADVAALAQQADTGLADAKHTPAAGQQLAQIIDARGRVVDATPGFAKRPLLGARSLAQARRQSVTVSRTLVTGDQRVRLLAMPIRAQDQHLVAVVGQSLEDREQAVADLTNVLLVGGPVALLLASLGGYVLAGTALRPVEVMRRRERAFIADASHELRSPLTMLRTELELLARDQPSGAALEAATSSAIEETDRLSRLADDLLLLSRSDHQRLALRRVTGSLAELVDAGAARARRRASARGVRIGVTHDADVPLVLADPDRIGQALDNLLHNALRYAVQKVELTIRIAGSSVEIHVLDDGPGFPPEFLSRAWDR